MYANFYQRTHILFFPLFVKHLDEILPYWYHTFSRTRPVTLGGTVSFYRSQASKFEWVDCSGDELFPLEWRQSPVGKLLLWSGYPKQIWLKLTNIQYDKSARKLRLQLPPLYGFWINSSQISCLDPQSEIKVA